MTFRPKPTAAALAEALAPAARALPSTRGDKQPPTVQVNFRCTAEMAETIARLGADAGSTRRWLARLMAASGVRVPDADLNPSEPKRRYPR